MNLKEKAREIKKNTIALFFAMKKKETPWYAKVVAGITVVYALSPIDFIPDFIPVLGYLDDVIILPALIVLSIKMIPKHVMEEAHKEAGELMINADMKKWYYALPIVIIWIIAAVFLINLFLI